jgi:hypothetical protein
MGAPHNTKRYGEQWNQNDLAVMSAEIERYLDLIVVSGGWAWHYMSPPHDELKHAHDHKDADVFVVPEKLWMLLDRLKADGYEKTWTRFDGVTDDFVRYTKIIESDAKPVKIIFDIFTEEVPSVETSSGVAVVEPMYLLSLYGKKHSSIECFSVAIAKDLIAKGEGAVGHPKMADFTKFWKKP